MIPLWDLQMLEGEEGDSFVFLCFSLSRFFVLSVPCFSIILLRRLSTSHKLVWIVTPSAKEARTRVRRHGEKAYFERS